MPKIIPISELKKSSEISELCHSTDEPIFITKNGYGDMVLMSMEAYEKNFNREMIYRELELSERQISEGKARAAELCVAELEAKYEL